MPPKVSVIMAVHNGEAYLREAVESILNETFADFEYIIIDDGSTDSTPRILTSYTDSRIRLLPNEHNIGLTRSLNRGLEAAQGEYIARMDADDISLPLRFEKQVAYLDSHPEVGLLATNIQFVNERGKLLFDGRPMHSSARSSIYLKWALLWQNPLPHATVMIRRSLLTKTGLIYDPTVLVGQDYDLWNRLSHHTELGLIFDVCLRLRISSGSISCKYSQKQYENQLKVMRREIRTILGKVASEEGIRSLHATVLNMLGADNDFFSGLETLRAVTSHFMQLARSEDDRTAILADTRQYIEVVMDTAAKHLSAQEVMDLLNQRFQAIFGFPLYAVPEKGAVINHILRYVPPDNYAASFGLQWNTYRRTQLDSYTGLSISKERLIRLAGGTLDVFKDEAVLEAGCGAGRFTEQMLKAGARVFAIDLSSAVEANYRNFGGHPSYFVCQADLRDLPVDSEQFDVVICIGVIQHTPNPELTIEALCNNVKPGGLLVIDHYTYGYALTGLRRVLRSFLLIRSASFSLWFCMLMVRAIWPLHRLLWRLAEIKQTGNLLPRLRQKFLNISPVVDYHDAYTELGPDLLLSWAILDTHDTLTDVYKHLRSAEEIASSLASFGMVDIEVGYAGNGVEARARKPIR